MKPSSSKHDTLLRGNKKIIAEDDKCESDDNENDDTACIVCNQLWQNYKGKKSKLWFMCDGYVCPKCSPKGLNESDDFYCDKCSTGDI